MASTTLSEQVTIDRSYFETLLRSQELYLRSQAVDDGNTNNGSNGFVPVKRAEYDELLVTARRHAALRTSLLNGGVSEDILALLSGDDAEQTNTSSAHHKTPTKANNAAANGTNGHTSTLRAQAPSYVGSGSSHCQSSTGQQRYGHDHSPRHEHSPAWADDAPYEDSGSPSETTTHHRQSNSSGTDTTTNGGSPPSTQIERQAVRTLFLSSLDPGTTHLDITKAIRGGQILDVHLHASDKPGKTATVSFLRGVDARSFYEHVQRFGLWIKQKRIEVRWADRQFTLQPHVLSRIASGATRNLIIRRCDSRTTELDLREELDHISGLAVINVEFFGASCRLQLNSVHCAMFARTCMMSRS
jgi:hypothetical protein